MWWLFFLFIGHSVHRANLNKVLEKVAVPAGHRRAFGAVSCSVPGSNPASASSTVHHSPNYCGSGEGAQRGTAQGAGMTVISKQSTEKKERGEKREEKFPSPGIL